jgi:hypothetical protein
MQLGGGTCSRWPEEKVTGAGGREKRSQAACYLSAVEGWRGGAPPRPSVLLEGKRLAGGATNHREGHMMAIPALERTRHANETRQGQQGRARAGMNAERCMPSSQAFL